jgi:hypothetical protein
MYLSQRVQEHQLVGGQIDMGPIESLRLVFARQSKEDQHMISSVRQLDRLLQQLLVVVGRPNAKPAASSLLYRQPIPTATPPAPTGTTGQPGQRAGIQHQCK